MSVGRRKGPGRPRLPASESKGKVFSVRLSRAERAQVEAAAKARGLTAVAWAREILLREAAGLPAPADLT
jgi:hypothetical protein